MNKKIIIVSLFALLVFAVFAPVFAVQPTTTSIKAMQAGTVTGIEKEWFSGDIRHRSGVVNEGTIRLFIPATASTPTYTLSFYNVYHAAQDMVDKNGAYAINVDAKWIYKVNGEVKGTFEGQINWNVNCEHFGNSLAHGVLFGTGMFEGQTLRFFEDYQNSGTVWYGTLFDR